MDTEKRVHIISFRKYWPSFIYPLQVIDPYGAIIPDVPTIRTTKKYKTVTKNYKITLWEVLALISGIEEIWSPFFFYILHFSVGGFLFLYHALASMIFSLYKTNMIIFKNTSYICYKFIKKTFTQRLIFPFYSQMRMM